jgi:hypothetical protein
MQVVTDILMHAAVEALRSRLDDQAGAVAFAASERQARCAALQSQVPLACMQVVTDILMHAAVEALCSRLDTHAGSGVMTFEALQEKVNDADFNDILNVIGAYIDITRFESLQTRWAKAKTPEKKKRFRTYIVQWIKDRERDGFVLAPSGKRQRIFAHSFTEFL